MSLESSSKDDWDRMNLGTEKTEELCKKLDFYTKYMGLVFGINEDTSVAFDDLK
jgi:hypothetical protein